MIENAIEILRVANILNEQNKTILERQNAEQLYWLIKLNDFLTTSEKSKSLKITQTVFEKISRCSVNLTFGTEKIKEEFFSWFYNFLSEDWFTQEHLEVFCEYFANSKSINFQSIDEFKRSFNKISIIFGAAKNCSSEVFKYILDNDYLISDEESKLKNIACLCANAFINLAALKMICENPNTATDLVEMIFYFSRIEKPELESQFISLINTNCVLAIQLSNRLKDLEAIQNDNLSISILNSLLPVLLKNQDKLNIGQIINGFLALIRKTPYVENKEIENLAKYFMKKYFALVKDNIDVAIKIGPALNTLCWYGALDNPAFGLLCQYPDKAINLAKGLGFLEKNKFGIINNEKFDFRAYINFIVKHSDLVPNLIAFSKLIENDISYKLDPTDRLEVAKASTLGFESLISEINKQIKSGPLLLEDFKKFALSKADSVIGNYFLCCLIYGFPEILNEMNDEDIQNHAQKLLDNLTIPNAPFYTQRIELALHILYSIEKSEEVTQKINEISKLPLTNKPNDSEVNSTQINNQVNNNSSSATSASNEAETTASTTPLPTTANNSTLLSARKNFTAIDSARPSNKTINKVIEIDFIPETPVNLSFNNVKINHENNNEIQGNKIEIQINNSAELNIKKPPNTEKNEAIIIDFSDIDTDEDDNENIPANLGGFQQEKIKSQTESIEKNRIEQLKIEIQKCFNRKNGSYVERGARDPQRDICLAKVNMLINKNNVGFNDMLNELQKIAESAQKDHEVNSGSRWLGCGPLINATCGFKQAVDDITAIFDDIQTTQQHSLLGQAKYPKYTS